MDMTPIAQVLHENPNAVGVAAGAIVVLLVQCWKKMFNLESGGDRNEKVLVAIVASALTAWATQHLAGEINLSQFISAAVVAWLTAAGVHGTFLRSDGQPLTDET